MTPHRILKDFPGSQTGLDTELRLFKAGDTVDLSDHLASAVVPAGYAEPVKKGKAPETGAQVVDVTVTPSEETKVIDEAPEKKTVLEKLTGKGSKNKNKAA